jgi:hypothetical protein
VSDLRTLVVRRGGKNRRVALLAADVAIVRGLEQNGCTVVADPDLDELAKFAPDAVVAFDGALDGGALFPLIARAVPQAELIFSCANAGGASALVQQLVGREAPQGQALEPLEKKLADAGYRVLARDLVVVPFRPTGLSADAEAALRALLEQVNPAAAADRFLYVARQGQPQRHDEFVAGKLDVVRSDAELAAARGQYVAFGGSDHARVMRALENATNAWAVAGDATSVRQALLTGACSRESYVIDRERIGPFALNVPEDAPAADAVMFARLAAVFPPLFVGGPALPRVAPITEALGQMTARPLRMLTTLDALIGETPLRHSVIDRVDEELKKRTPNLHRALKGLAEDLGKLR